MSRISHRDAPEAERRLTLPYGSGVVEAALSGVCILGTIDIADTPEVPDVPGTVADALARPIGLDKPLRRIVRPDERVLVLVSDMFRQTRADQVLPVLMRTLNDAGVPDAAIALLFATGTHRAPTAEEQARILGLEMYRRFEGRIHVHNPHDAANLVTIGMTSRGTPVIVNRLAVETDRLIATGAVVLHYFGGFGGGRKSIVPGISSVVTISHNHAMNLDPREDRLNPAVRIGAMDDNPVAEDMLEAARLLKVDFIVNTVLNREGRIAGVFAGDLEAAHRAAAEFARRLFVVPVRKQADLIVAASGGTKNFVQSHKALYNAYQAMRSGGRIVFVSKCEEGLGGEQFAKWLRLGNRKAVIAELRRQSEINGQTALSTLEKAPSAVFVTDMSEAEVALLGGRKAADLEQALALALCEVPEHPTCYVMPSAAYSVPCLGGCGL